MSRFGKSLCVNSPCASWRKREKVPRRDHVETIESYLVIGAYILTYVHDPSMHVWICCIHPPPYGHPTSCEPTLGFSHERLSVSLSLSPKDDFAPLGRSQKDRERLFLLADRYGRRVGGYSDVGKVAKKAHDGAGGFHQSEILYESVNTLPIILIGRNLRPRAHAYSRDTASRRRGRVGKLDRCPLAACLLPISPGGIPVRFRRRCLFGGGCNTRKMPPLCLAG